MYKVGIVYVLPLRVEPHISQTHVWPAAGELVSLYHCAILVWGYGIRLGETTIHVAGEVLEDHSTLAIQALSLQKSADWTSIVK